MEHIYISLKPLLESADIFPDPMLVVSVDGTIEVANRAFTMQFGLAGSLVGKRLDTLTAQPTPSTLEFLQGCARSAKALYGTLIFRNQSQTIPFQVRGVAYPPEAAPYASQVLLYLQPLPSESQTKAGAAHLDTQAAHWQEITDSLRRQSQILEVTLASIGDAVIVTDAEGRVTFLNSVAESLTGWSFEEVRNQPLKSVFHIVNERTRLAVEDPVRKVLQTGVVVGLANHTVLISRSGVEFAIDDSAAPIKMRDGTLFGVVLIFRDITQQRLAEYRRAWLASIVESSEDPIISKTIDGQVTSWNAAATRLFGYEAHEIVGKPITTIIPSELQAEEQMILARVRAGQRLEHFETVRQAKDGRRIDVSLSVSPIKSENGEIVGASKIARDISSRKERERLQSESERLKDEFLATLGHELRNPLAPIQSATDLICRTVNDQQPPSQLRTSCQILQRQLGHLTRLVDDLLDVSRITSGRLELQHEALQLAPLLLMTVESLQPAFDAKQQTLSLALAPGPHFVRGDRVRLTQVFSNLLQNANRYTPPSGHIQLGLEYQSGNAVVRVRDDGIGITEENLHKVFEPFFQGRRAYGREGGGLGIGLTLARRLVQMHGGAIEARSEGVDHGSEFIVRLPLSETAESAPVGPAVVQVPEAHHRRVLIADDNEDAALSLAMLLQNLGHETRTAHNGADALEVAEQFLPEVMFLDLAMPTLHGYEAARRARNRPWGQKVLLVALTGWGQQADRDRTRAAGFDHHLVKPVNLETLRELLA